MTDNSDEIRCPRRFDLIRLTAGDLQAEDARALSAHTATCPRCAAELAAIERGREDFLARHPFEEVAPAMLRGARRRNRGRRLAFGLVPAGAAAALLMVIFQVLRPGPLAEQPPGPGIRTKGEISLGFYVQRGDRAVPGRPGETLRRDDRIQFAYSSGSNRYVFLLSLDDRGAVSNFNHQASPTSVPIQPGSGRLLEGSIILDASVGPERIFAVFSDRPLHFDQVRGAAQEAYREIRRGGGGVGDIDSLPLPHPQASILIQKK